MTTRSDHSNGSTYVPLEEALSGSASQRVGWFRYYFDDDHWEWSPGVYAIHGYDPGSVVPTTELMLSHKHPEDYQAIADVIALVCDTRQPLTTRHRIIDTHRDVHHVVIVGDELRDSRGEVIGTHGFYIDVTPDEESRQDLMSAEISRIAENRAVIEQAKGMLMVVYGIDESAAFELLRWRSQEANVKLRLLAAQITADFKTVPRDGMLPPRAIFDQLLLTAHHRVKQDDNTN